jgi:hypothetical protein
MEEPEAIAPHKIPTKAEVSAVQIAMVFGRPRYLDLLVKAFIDF